MLWSDTTNIHINKNDFKIQGTEGFLREWNRKKIKSTMIENLGKERKLNLFDLIE